MTKPTHKRTRAIGQNIKKLCLSIEQDGSATAYILGQRLEWDDGNARKYCRRAQALKLLTPTPIKRGTVWTLVDGWRGILALHGPKEPPKCPAWVVRPGIGTRWAAVMPWKAGIAARKPGA